jgi:hypothetical protein
MPKRGRRHEEMGEDDDAGKPSEAKKARTAEVSTYEYCCVSLSTPHSEQVPKWAEKLL